MEYVFCATNHDHRLGTALRLPHLLLLVPSLFVMDARSSYGILDMLVKLGVLIQQDGQALGSLFPIPCGCHLYSGVRWLRLLPRLDKIMGAVHFKRGKLTASLLHLLHQC